MTKENHLFLVKCLLVYTIMGLVSIGSSACSTTFMIKRKLKQVCVACCVLNQMVKQF